MDPIAIRRIFYLFLGLAYLVAGVFIYLRKMLPDPWGIVLLIVFTVYGSWRMYRAFKLKS
jgi:uncharacterized membrane protein